jgi:hypothetical protein
MVTTAEDKKLETSPVIVDLGKRKKKEVKRLRQGGGNLMEEVQGCLDELAASGTITKDAQPVILIVREKRRRGSSIPKFY